MSVVRGLKGFFALIFVSAYFWPSLSYATDAGQDYCIPFYQGIKNVSVSYEQKTPFEGQEWTKALELNTRRAKSILKEGNIALSISEGDMPQRLAEDTIYIKVIYSYLNKDKTTIALGHDYLATWIETTRKITKPDGSSEASTQKSPVAKFFPAQGAASLMTISGAVSGLFEGPACNILHFSGGKRCSNTLDITKNTIIPNFGPCIKDRPKLEPELEKILKEIH